MILFSRLFMNISYWKINYENTIENRLQKWMRELLIEKLDIHPEDIESRSMGAKNEDLIMDCDLQEKNFQCQ